MLKNTGRVLWIFTLGFVISTLANDANRTCGNRKLDLFVVLDSSVSLHEEQYAHLKQFLSKMMNHFDFNNFQTRVGLMQFSDKSRAVIEFNFGEHTTKEAIQDHLETLIHQRGNTTMVGEALSKVNDKVFPENANDDPEKDKVLLLITDGASHDLEKALEEAEKLKKRKDVSIITIGAGSEKWVDTFKWSLNRLGSKPVNNHRVRFRNLRKIIRKLVQSICNSKKRQPAPPHKCFQEKRDILVMIDGSKTTTKRNFDKVKRLLTEVLSRLDIGPDRLHVAVIQYSASHETALEIPLNMYSNSEDMLAAVSKLHYLGGSKSDLGSALEMAQQEVFNGYGSDRLTAPDIMVIFTDGNFENASVHDKIEELGRRKKTRIVSVAVRGKLPLNKKNIEALALNKDDIYDIDTVRPTDLFDNVVQTTCKIVHCTSAPAKCSPENQDILILLDGKASIGRNNFKFALRDIQQFVGKMTLGKTQTHMGVIQYGSTGDVTEEVVLGRDILRTIIKGIISKITFKNSPDNSDLAFALSVATDMLLRNSDPSRSHIPKTIVIISDGDMTDFTEANSIAETLRVKGVRVIALSHGSNSKREPFVSSMRLLATGPKEYYRLTRSYFQSILKELQKTVCISEPLIPDSCFQQKRNVFFLLDSSRGRGQKKFNEVKSFMENLVRKLHLGPSQTHVGFMQYNDQVNIEDAVVFNKNDSSGSILWRIQNMRFIKGKTITIGRALKVINQKVFIEETNQDPDYRDVLIIITHRDIKDGQLAFNEAEKLKHKGVDIISIATGHKKVNQQVKMSLEVLSSAPTNVHSSDYLSLWNVVDDILVDICGLGKCPSRLSTTCIPRKQDIVMAIDGSRSVGGVNFKRLKRFITRLSKRLELAKDKTHLGILQVGADKKSKFQFNMGEFPDRDDVLYMIKDMEYLDHTTTYMGHAMQIIRDQVFNRQGIDRQDTPNTLVIFSDGQAHDGTLMFEEAERMKMNDTRIIAVGYGAESRRNKTTFMANLLKLASAEKDVFVINFRQNDLILEEKIEEIAKELVQVNCPKAPQPPIVNCKQGNHDIFLLVDGSRSINPRNFRLVKRFLKKLVSEFELGPKRTHLGMIQFSDKAKKQYVFGFSQGLSNRATKRKIRDMKYGRGGETLTGDALRSVDEHVFNGRNGDRPNVSDVLILFTDGSAHDIVLAKERARRMKERNVRIIAIAAGEESRNPKLVRQLEAIATSPLDVYKSEFNELTDIIDKLIEVQCDITESQPQGT